ncbi:MAG: host-nuclease inhibitor Gam family protein [Syntrophobacteraceae bacterium]
MSPKDRNDVDGLVEPIGRLDLQLALLETEYSEQFHDLLSLYHEHIAKLVAQRKSIEDTVKDFCEEARKAEFAKKRSRKLPFGHVSFRASEKIVVSKGKEEIVITTLLSLQLTDCVRNTGKLNREAMSKLSDADLARASVRRQTRNRTTSRSSPTVRRSQGKSTARSTLEPSPGSFWGS